MESARKGAARGVSFLVFKQGNGQLIYAYVYKNHSTTANHSTCQNKINYSSQQQGEPKDKREASNNKEQRLSRIYSYILLIPSNNPNYQNAKIKSPNPSPYAPHHIHTSQFIHIPLNYSANTRNKRQTLSSHQPRKLFSPCLTLELLLTASFLGR